jgi:hypothetical protein
MDEQKIYVGSNIIIKGEWRQPIDPLAIPSDTDPLTDPGQLSFFLYLPDRSTVQYVYGVDAEIVRDVQGKYHVEYLVSLKGHHNWSWLPTGNAAQPVTGEFYAHPI